MSSEGETNAPSSAPAHMSFTEAAAQILRQHGQPLHFSEITRIALERQLIRTAARTPQDTMYASIIEETQRRETRREQQRSDRKGKGILGLEEWKPVGLRDQIARHNDTIRKTLR